MGMVDWSELEQDLLGEIAKNIGSVVDFLVFSRVCPYWRLAAIKENRVVYGAQFPWLVLAEKEDEPESSSTNNNTNKRGFFDLSDGKRYDLDAPQLSACRMWGSSLGLIVTLNTNLDLRLVNPLTPFELSLPHIYTLKHQPGSGYETEPNYKDTQLSKEWFMSYFIVKAIVFKSKNQLMVATIYGERHCLAIARPGDECWTEIEFGVPGNWAWVKDILYFNGQLLIVHEAGILSHCEFDGQEIPKLVALAEAPTQVQQWYKTYLVDSLSDLLMVVRKLVDHKLGYVTGVFDIYKLDFEKKMWMECRDLGDSALFLGDSYSMSLCSSDVVGCERNVIYFTDDNFEQWDADACSGGHDIGVFHLNENVVHSLPNDSLGIKDLRFTPSCKCCPIWMMPNLF